MSIRNSLKNKVTKRIQFELTEKGIAQIEDLVEATDVTTRKDLFNYALTFLVWAIEEKKRGRIIASIDEQADKYKELVMPILTKAAQSKIKIGLDK